MSNRNSLRSICIAVLVASAVALACADEPETEPGADSPEALMERFLKGIVAGDVSKVEACFDRSTEAGDIGARAMGLVTRELHQMRALRAEADEKFGDEGLSKNNLYDFCLTIVGSIHSVVHAGCTDCRTDSAGLPGVAAGDG